MHVKGITLGTALNMKNLIKPSTFHFSEVLDKGVLQFHHRDIDYM